MVSLMRKKPLFALCLYPERDQKAVESCKVCIHKVIPFDLAFDRVYRRFKSLYIL